MVIKLILTVTGAGGGLDGPECVPLRYITIRCHIKTDKNDKYIH